MRAFFRYLLMALVLLIVFLASVMASMRFAIHGRQTSVPKLAGLTAGEAARAASAVGLLFEVENRFYSSEVPAGHILSQLPLPGVRVRRGWKVRAAESLGPQRVEIPSVLGESPRAAEINLAQRGLQLGTVARAHLPGLPPEVVAAQSPPPKAGGVASPKVNLLLTAAPEEKPACFVMPDFVGRAFGEATAAVAEGGFTVGPVSVALRAGSPLAVPDHPAKLKPIATDTVIAQSPAAGQKVVAGTRIAFSVLR
jgi:beta-lactam-binding protein with PASTA domain